MYTMTCGAHFIIQTVNGKTPTAFTYESTSKYKDKAKQNLTKKKT